MFQSHISLPNGGVGRGPVFGHCVSRDLAHWAKVDVAVWNDQPYDDVAIYTGSTTIVNGTPTIVYPGLCAPKPSYPQCDGNQDHCHLAAAVPSNASDPLLRNWSKPSFNPLVNSTQRDPSSAWRTPAGEWRMVTLDTTVYGSMDFAHWYTIGRQAGFHQGECQSFFPTPRSTPGSAPPPPGAARPTHIHKSGGIHDGDLAPTTDGPVGPPNGGDWYAAGIYSAGAPKASGTWQPLHTGDHGDRDYQCLNHADNSYAMKDFEDTKDASNPRRINWGWANLGPSCLTMPRELTWHDELQMLVQSPLPEMALLRKGPPLATIASPTPIPAGDFLPLNVIDRTGTSRANTSQIAITFALPSAACRLGVVFAASSTTTSNASNSGKLVYVDFVPNASSLQVGVIDGGLHGARARDAVYSASMHGYDLPPLPNLQSSYQPPGCSNAQCPVSYNDYTQCQQHCANDQHCLTYTFQPRPALPPGGQPILLGAPRQDNFSKWRMRSLGSAGSNSSFVAFEMRGSNGTVCLSVAGPGGNSATTGCPTTLPPDVPAANNLHEMHHLGDGSMTLLVPQSKNEHGQSRFALTALCTWQNCKPGEKSAPGSFTGSRRLIATGGSNQRWRITADGRLAPASAPSLAVQAVPSATCEFRTGAPEPVKSPIPGIVSGLNTKHVSAADALRKHQGVVATLRMSPQDTTLTLSVFVDSTIAEVYWQQGRVAQTIAVPTYLEPVAPSQPAVAVVSDGPSVVQNATVYALGSAWVSADEVLHGIGNE
jgi:hypothetical protein